MASPSLVIQTSISIRDKAAAVASFGTIGIFAKSPSVNPLTYDVGPDGLAAMLEDGFTAGSAAYVIAQTIAAQEVTVNQIKVFPRALQNDQSYTLTPVAALALKTYSVSIVGSGGVQVDCAFTADDTPTIAEIVTGLLADINAKAPVGVTAVAEGGAGTETNILLTQAVAGVRFYLRSAARLTVKDTSVDAGIAADLSAGLAEDNDFYGVIIDSTSSAEIAAAAAWANTNRRLFVGSSIDSDIVATGSTDVASVVKETKNNRAVIAFGRDGFARVGDAIFARQMSRDPGTSTWAGKALSAVIIDDLTATEIGYARGKNALVYVPISELGWVLDGKTAGGRYADITRDADWLEANLQAAAISAIANLEKVPYNDGGIAYVENSLTPVFDLAVRNTMIEPEFTVTPPVADQQSTGDRANRIMGDFKWSAQLSGAIHATGIQGTLGV